MDVRFTGWDIQGLIIYKNIDSIPLIPQHGLWGGRFGEASKFENGNIKRLSFRDNGVKYKMVRDKEALTLYNFKEWLKFQHYADKNL